MKALNPMLIYLNKSQRTWLKYKKLSQYADSIKEEPETMDE